ncbi:MAG: hypothetical protein KDA28_03980, partial [Phycisphaerales bacterium]|nr:hypothetical protein [Phycisphaerales bacterium]
GRTRWEGQKEIARSVRDNRVTHVRSGHSLGKTNEFAATLIEWLLTNRDGRVLITGPTFNQVKQSLWKEVRELYFKAAERGFPLGNGMRKEEWELSDRHDARLAAVDNISAIQGGRGAKCLVIVDEAQGVEDELWDALDSLMTAEGSRMLTGGNPLFARGRWHQMHEDDVEANLIRLDAETHPNILTGREIIPGGITRMWIDMMRRKHGPDYLSSPVYQGRVLGEFPTDGVFQVISLGMLEDAAKGTEGVKGEDRVAGLDVARHGTDRNVFIVLDETRTVVHVDSWTGLDLDETADRAKALCVEHGIELQPKSGPGHLKIDIGMGAGVRDILKRTVKVELVDFGSKPGNDWSGLLNKGEGGKATMRFLNRRAYLHWVA